MCAPAECQCCLVALNESWPSSRNTDWKMSRSSPFFFFLVLCLCWKWQRDKAEIVDCRAADVIGFHWNPLTHETKQSAHVVFSHTLKRWIIDISWRCFTMPNCQLPMKNTYWCGKSARRSKCHFTTQWARTSLKSIDNSFNEIHLWFLCLAATQLLSLPLSSAIKKDVRATSFSVLCVNMLFYIQICYITLQLLKWCKSILNVSM